VDLYEHQGKDLFARAGIALPQRTVATTPLEAADAAERLGGHVAVKVQVQMGGRGKGGGVALVHSPEEAATLAKETATVKFDATVEAHLRLGVDPRHADQMVRGTVVLPHGTGKVVRVAVFAQGDKAQEALRAGADEVGGEDLVKKIEAGWLEFDVALATPDSMGMVGKLGKILGRRGLMPNPKAGTITFDLERAVGEVKGGRVEFKVDKAAIIHVPVGKSSFEADAIVGNLAALVDAVNRARPSGAKGQYLKGLTIASTMGPGIRVDLPQVLAVAAAA